MKSLWKLELCGIRNKDAGTSKKICLLKTVDQFKERIVQLIEFLKTHGIPHIDRRLYGKLSERRTLAKITMFFL